MNKSSRCSRIEVRLTPLQCVLLFLKEAQRAGPFSGFGGRLANTPPAEFPRDRINRQISSAVREGMKGEPPERIRRAVRAAAKQTDFLTLLILEVNRFVLDDAQSQQLSLELLLEKVRHRGQAWKGEEHEEWFGFFTIAAGGICMTTRAIRHIESEHFAGTPLLFSDACQALETERILVRKVSDVYHEVVLGCPGLPLDPDHLADHLKPHALFLVQCLTAKARSGTLRAFNEYEASLAVMRPYWSGAALEDCLKGGSHPAGVSK